MANEEKEKNQPISIDSIEFTKDSKHAPEMPNREDYRIPEDSLNASNEALKLDMTIKSDSHQSHFHNYVTFQASLDAMAVFNSEGRIDHYLRSINIYITPNFNIEGDDKDDLGHTELNYINQLDEDSVHVLKSMIAHETIDLDNFSLNQPVNIYFGEEVDEPPEFSTDIEGIIYLGKYRTRKGRFTNANGLIDLINRADYYNKNAEQEDVRDQMKYELSYFAENMSLGDDLSQIDGMIFKFYYLICDDIDQNHVYKKMNEAINLINKVRSYPGAMGIDMENPDGSFYGHLTYIKRSIAILDNYDVSHPKFF